MNVRTISKEIITEDRALAFRKVMTILAIISLIAALILTMVYSPHTVTIDDKHWECTSTEPNGIEADCTNFTKKKYSLRTQ